METKVRQAVIIGINDYKDPDIPNLSGAVNDATAIHQRLKDFGEFEIDETHFLTDAAANCKSIRKAISDLLWRADPCDLSLLYFSGHGFRDGYGNGYIAPSDMSKNEPFVSGISTQELKRVISKSLNKQCVLVIIDCCFSGILTKGESERGIEEISFDDITEEIAGEGKIIFASSGEDQKSRENELNDKNMCHGIFTYHLIEGLDGKASDTAGNITLDRLVKYVEDQFVDKKQKPTFYAADSSQLDKIRIAVVSNKLKQFIEKKLKDAEEYIFGEDITSLMVAIEIVQNVLDNSNDNSEAIDLQNNINNALGNYREKADNWLRANVLRKRPFFPKVYKELQQLVPCFSFNEIIRLEQRKKQLLTYLCDASNEIESDANTGGDSDFSTNSDLRDPYIKIFRSFENPTNLSVPTLGSANRN